MVDRDFNDYYRSEAVIRINILWYFVVSVLHIKELYFF